MGSSVGDTISPGCVSVTLAGGTYSGTDPSRGPETFSQNCEIKSKTHQKAKPNENQ